MIDRQKPFIISWETPSAPTELMSHASHVMEHIWSYLSYVWLHRRALLSLQLSLTVKPGIGVLITQFSSSDRMLARKKYANKSFSKVCYTGKALLRLGCVHTPYVSILAPKAIFITFSGVNKRVHMLHFRLRYCIFCTIWNGWLALYLFCSVLCLQQRDGAGTHYLLHSW